MSISTSDLSRMPDIELLRRMLQSVAMIDAIMMSQLAPGSFPTFQFHTHWSGNEQLATWNNGQGDDFFALFTEVGCWLKGFAHEAEMSPFRKKPPQLWPGLFEGMPHAFQNALLEPAFDLKCTTFCIWRLKQDTAWNRGNFQLPLRSRPAFPGFEDADLSGMILSPLANTPEQWASYFDEQFEVGTPLVRSITNAIFAQTSLTNEMISLLAPGAIIDQCRNAAVEIGYPLAD